MPGRTLLKFVNGFFPGLADFLSGGVIGLATPMSAGVYLGGNRSMEDRFTSGVVVTTTSFSSLDMGTNSRVDEWPELLLLPRLNAFSGLLAITKSGSSCNCFWARRRIMNQKTTKDIISTAAMGTTMAGMSLFRLFEDDELPAAAVALVAAAVLDLELVVCAFALD